MHRKRSGALGLILLASSLAMSSPMLAQQGNAQMPIVGDMAPDFTLKYFDGSDLKEVKLSDYRGKQNVVLAFYVFAFTGG
jgi:thioredoxin-dependent peroxiredoxin